MVFKKYFLIILIILLTVNINADVVNQEFDNALDFDAIKTKHIDVDINYQIPILINSYSENSSFIFKTPIFYDTRTQEVDLEAYYLENGEKVFAKIETDSFENKYAVFKIKNISKDRYDFFIKANVKSENKIVLSDSIYDLNKPINDFNNYKKSSENINSNKSEIITLVNTLKNTNNALEEIVTITNWVMQNIEYDMSPEFSEAVLNSIDVLSLKKGVCDEFANLTAALLRARGIPVRYISGVANSSLNWESHAWLEAYIPTQGWIPVDPTYGEVAFVDSSHISLSKMYDPSDVKDTVTTTGDVDIGFGEKIKSFKINEQNSYQDLGYSDFINFSFKAEQDLKEKSSFTIKVVAKNTTAHPISNLIILNVDKDFELIYPNSLERIIYLAPFEKKEFNYHFLLPDLDNSVSYNYILATQLKDMSSYVNVYSDNRGIFNEAFFVNDPVYSFKDGDLKIEVSAYNYTKKEKTLNFDFNIGKDSFNEIKTINPNDSLLYEKIINIKPDDNVIFNISGDYDYLNNINILSDKKIEVNEIKDINKDDNSDINIRKDFNDITSNDSKNNDINQDIWENINNYKEENPNFSYIVPIIIFVLIIILIIFISLNNKNKKYKNISKDYKEIKNVSKNVKKQDNSFLDKTKIEDKKKDLESKEDSKEESKKEASLEASKKESKKEESKKESKEESKKESKEEASLEESLEESKKEESKEDSKEENDLKTIKKLDLFSFNDDSNNSK